MATSSPACFCVTSAREKIPDLPFMDAKDFPNNALPENADILLFRYGNTAHVAVKIADMGEYWLVFEGNYDECQTGERMVRKDDPALIGGFSMAVWRSYTDLSEDQQAVLACESGGNQYNAGGAVLRGKDGEWGMGQFMKGTWGWFAEMRQKEGLRMLDILNAQDQIEMFSWAWDHGFADHWTCYRNLE